MLVLLDVGSLLSLLPHRNAIGSGISVLLTAMGMIFYFLPSIIAGSRKSTDYYGVLAANLFLGWSILGWVAALLWALYSRTEAETRAMLIDDGRLAAALENSQFPTPQSSPAKPGRAHARDEKPLAVFLLGVAVMLAILTGIGLINRIAAGRDSKPLTIANAMATSPIAPASDQLDQRATSQDIINACGQPEQNWTTTLGEGTHQQNVQHLWYSRIPAEIRLSIRPNESREESRHWVFAGAAQSPKSDSTYSGEDLKQRMPCMARWADAYTAATQDRKATN